MPGQYGRKDVLPFSPPACDLMWNHTGAYARSATKPPYNYLMYQHKITVKIIVG
jgi:hypothetical protein